MRKLKRSALLVLLVTVGCDRNSDGDLGRAEEIAAALWYDDVAQKGSAELALLVANEDENLTSGPPLVVPEQNFSQSPREVEPNNDRETASPLDDSYSARGTTTNRDIDVFYFDTHGTPSLWFLEVTGEDLFRVSHMTAARVATVARRASDNPNRHTIGNLFLLPGRHFVEVRAARPGSDYTVRVVPLGPPDPNAEYEPNDEPSRAHLLRFGAARTGHLLDEDDVDFYRFSLGAPEQILAQVRPPPGVETSLILSARSAVGSVSKVAEVQNDGDGSNMVYRALLPAGEYVLAVQARRGSSFSTYGIRVDRLNFYARPIDLEPNNSAATAVTVGADLVVRGALDEHSDNDWYKLPALEVPAALAIAPSQEPEDFRGTLVLHDAAGRRTRPGLVWNAADSVFGASVDAGEGHFLRIMGAGSYDFQLTFNPGPASTAIEPLQATILLSGPMAQLAAFSSVAQRVDLSAELRNRGSETEQLRIDAVSSHWAFRPRVERADVTLRPGERASIPVQVEVAPDVAAGQSVWITVRAVNSAGAQRAADLELGADCGLPPVNPSTWFSVPPALRGGFNVAASAFGSSFESEVRRERLFDGFTQSDRYWSTSLPAEVTVDLAGDGPVSLAGVLLHPQNAGPMYALTKDFKISVSQDGQTFREVLEGTLSRAPVEQAFVFEAPVAATHARLTIASSYAGTTGDVNLGQFKVVAVPGSRPLGQDQQNIADPALGGFVVWSNPLLGPMPNAILSENVERYNMFFDALNPTEWVIGFHHNRAALVTELEWTQSRTGPGGRTFGEVSVSTSTESPVGPWTRLSNWTLNTESGSTSKLTLPEAKWARYVRLVSTEPETRARWYRPETIRVFEKQPDEGYRSILGEWGHYSRAASYESVLPQTVAATPEKRDDNDSMETAQELTLGVAVSQSVYIQRDEDWFSIDVPDNDNRLTLDVRGDPTLRAFFTLVDADGTEVPIEVVLAEDGLPVYEATVVPGNRYFVHVVEPPRSIAVVFDNSGSVLPYRATMYQAIARFAEGVQPGIEVVNILPFRDDPNDGFLMEEWTDQTYLLQQAINDYDRTDGSSAAEVIVHKATAELAGKPGTRAIVLLTDADSPSYSHSDQLWEAFKIVQPRIFVIELHLEDVATHQDDLQSWAAVNGGYHSYFRTNAELDVAFDRASCFLRRPALYTIAASTRHEELLGPGFLAVKSDSMIGPQAIELILDASGSMLQRVGDRRRIDIAREALTDLVQNTLPDDSRLALRVFGHRTPDACQTDLEIPLSPLDRAAVTARIAQTAAKNLAKTPIAESIELVAVDLRRASGQKQIVLITDGEETCGGDPAAAIQQLKEKQLDFRLNIIGFAIENPALKAEFEMWAAAGGGRYFDAKDAIDLSAAITESVRPKYQVLDRAGTIVAEGSVDGDPLELPAGTYTVRVLTTPAFSIEDVEIVSEQERQLTARARR